MFFLQEREMDLKSLIKVYLRGYDTCYYLAMRLKPPLLLIAILVTIATGCNSPQPTSIDKSQLEYHNSQWILSEMWAKKSIDEHGHVDEAQYMMELCEFRLENLENSKL